MTRHHAGERHDPRVPGDWSDAPSRDALQLIAEGVTQVAGFGVAAISVVARGRPARGDGRRRQRRGPRPPHRRSHPVDELMAEIEKADHWGLLRFLPHERLDIGDEDWGWVPDIEPIDAPDAWHPMDLLLAPLRSADGVLRGTLTMDLPTDGRRPGEVQRAVLQKYAEQAGRAVVTALDREELAEQVRLADAARTIVRQASAQQSLQSILDDSRKALTDGFRATGMWIHTFQTDGPGTGRHVCLVRWRGGGSAGRGHRAGRPLAARRGWHLQRSEVVSPERPLAASLSDRAGR